jgi:hypothetical protein
MKEKTHYLVLIPTMTVHRNYYAVKKKHEFYSFQWCLENMVAQSLPYAGFVNYSLEILKTFMYIKKTHVNCQYRIDFQ